MNMREYEEFSLTLESIRRGIDKLVNKAKEEPYAVFFWSVLSPDMVSDDGSFLKLRNCHAEKDPVAYILSNIGPEKIVFSLAYSRTSEIFYVGFCTYDHD